MCRFQMEWNWFGWNWFQPSCKHQRVLARHKWPIHGPEGDSNVLEVNTRKLDSRIASTSCSSTSSIWYKSNPKDCSNIFCPDWTIGKSPIVIGRLWKHLRRENCFCQAKKLQPTSDCLLDKWIVIESLQGVVLHTKAKKHASSNCRPHPVLVYTFPSLKGKRSRALISIEGLEKVKVSSVQIDGHHDGDHQGFRKEPELNL